MPPLGQALPTGESQSSPNLLYFNYLRNPVSLVCRRLPNWRREQAGRMELNYPDCPFICPPSHGTGKPLAPRPPRHDTCCLGTATDLVHSGAFEMR